MKNLLIVFFLFFVSTAASGQVDPNSSTCQTHRLYCAIMELQPAAKDYAMELSNHIHKYSKIYNTDPYITIAIAMQESGLRPIHRRSAGIKEVDVCDSNGFCRSELVQDFVYTDIGIFQFHHATISAYKLDPNKLFHHHMEYSVSSHMKILKSKIGMCADLGEKSWVCYHSRTAHLRKTYEKLVMPYYNRIRKFKPGA